MIPFDPNNAYDRDGIDPQKPVLEGLLCSPRQNNPTFGRAVLQGTIRGPEGIVVDEYGIAILPGDQDYGHTTLGRSVLAQEDESHIGRVMDYQTPEGTDPETIAEIDGQFGFPPA